MLSTTYQSDLSDASDIGPGHRTDTQGGVRLKTGRTDTPPVHCSRPGRPDVGQRFSVTFEAPAWASDDAGIRRLRAMLKRLGRGYGLRCVDLRHATQELEPNPDGEYSYRFTSSATVHAPKAAAAETDHQETAAPCCGSCPR